MCDRALIQQERGQFHNSNGFTAWQGFDERGFQIEFASWDQMAAGTVVVDPEVVTVGSVAFVRRALARLGIEQPPLDYPERLRSFLGRRLWETTWSEVRAAVRDEPGSPVFVKPIEQDKAFGGYVVAAFRDLIRTAGWPGEMRLWASDPVNFVSEWRYFVQEGEVLGVGFIKGDPFQHPDPEVVRAAVLAYTPDAPSAYGIDFGVIDSGETRLVEVNDGFALGCYGLGPLTYSRFLLTRWQELARRARVQPG